MSDTSTSFSPVEAAEELKRFGSVVLRDAWDPEHLRQLREAIVAFIEARAARVAAGEADPKELLQHQHGSGTMAMMIGAGFTKFLLLVEMFRGSDYHRLCAEHLQDDVFYVEWNRLAFRHHDPRGPDRTYVPYHQDSGSQDPRLRNVMNCWIPLDPGCGRDAPGLEVVRRVSEPNFPLRTPGPARNAIYDQITIDAERVAREFGDCLMAPEFEVGDGFAFTEHVIHRTYVTPQMTQPRINFEFRVFSPRHLGPGGPPANAFRLA